MGLALLRRIIHSTNLFSTRSQGRKLVFEPTAPSSPASIPAISLRASDEALFQKIVFGNRGLLLSPLGLAALKRF